MCACVRIGYRIDDGWAHLRNGGQGEPAAQIQRIRLTCKTDSARSLSKAGQIQRLRYSRQDAARLAVPHRWVFHGDAGCGRPPMNWTPCRWGPLCRAAATAKASMAEVEGRKRRPVARSKNISSSTRKTYHRLGDVNQVVERIARLLRLQLYEQRENKGLRRLNNTGVLMRTNKNDLKSRINWHAGE